MKISDTKKKYNTEPMNWPNGQAQHTIRKSAPIQ